MLAIVSQQTDPGAKSAILKGDQSFRAKLFLKSEKNLQKAGYFFFLQKNENQPILPSLQNNPGPWMSCQISTATVLYLSSAVGPDGCNIWRIFVNLLEENFSNLHNNFQSSQF